jgi:hypothetical protein
MLAANLDRLLTNFGFEKQQAVYAAAAKASVTIYLSCGQEVFEVTSVQTVEVNGEIVTIATSRGDRYGVELGDVRAVRLYAPK